MRQAIGQWWWPRSQPWSPPPATPYEVSQCAAQGGQWTEGRCVYPWEPVAAVCSSQGGTFNPQTWQCEMPMMPQGPCRPGQVLTYNGCQSPNSQSAIWGQQAVSFWRSMFR